MSGLDDILRPRGSLGAVIREGIFLLSLGVAVCWGIPLLLLALVLL